MYETEEEQAGIEWRIQSRRGWESNRSTGKETQKVAQVVLVLRQEVRFLWQSRRSNLILFLCDLQLFVLVHYI